VRAEIKACPHSLRMPSPVFGQRKPTQNSKLGAICMVASGVLLLPFFTTSDACELRLTCGWMFDLVAFFPWHDRVTRVYKTTLWRKCFSQATACCINAYVCVLLSGAFASVGVYVSGVGFKCGC
jgi:hypothetical protein